MVGSKEKQTGEDILAAPYTGLNITVLHDSQLLFIFLYAVMTLK